MARRLKQAVVVLAVLVAAAQLVRPGRAELQTDPSRTIQAHQGATSALVPVLDRACSDCHSNRAADWPWYGRVAPVSWLLARGVTEARQAVNFSEWGAYSPEQQRVLLAASCRTASDGTMPGRSYTFVRPDAALSARDVQTICAAAREGGVTATTGRER